MIKGILNGVIIMLAWWVWSWIILWSLNALSIVKIEANPTNSLALAVLLDSVMLIVALLARLGAS
jgi:hypothetical protein